MSRKQGQFVPHSGTLVFVAFTGSQQFCVIKTQPQVDEQLNKNEIERLKQLLRALEAYVGSSSSDDYLRHRLDTIEEKQDRILELLDAGKAGPAFKEENWATAQEAMDSLNRSIRTIYRLRDNGKIRCTKNGSEPRYYRPDIEKLKYSCMK